MGRENGLNSLTNVVSLGTVPDITGSTAASNAANAQVAAANQADATQLAMYNQTRADNQPWMQAGQTALGQLQGAMPDLTKQFTMADFHQDPGYQFQLDQGTQAMQRSAAAKGLLNSVGTEQNLNNYAQGMANTYYQQALSNFTNNQTQRYNMLSGLAGTGQTAANANAASGTNYANQVSQNQIGIGNSQAAASMQGYNGMMGLLKTGATVGAAAYGGKQ